MRNLQDQQITPHAVSKLYVKILAGNHYFCSISPLGAKVLWRELADEHADEQMVCWWATATVTHRDVLKRGAGLRCFHT